MNHQEEYGNNNERAIFLKDQQPYNREHTRYAWARQNLTGKKILEIGCTSGYGTQYFADIPGLDYTGIDYDEKVIGLAKEQFGSDSIKFIYSKLEDFPLEHYDTIVAMEVLEHLSDGLEWAQKLKEHCDKLLITMPYNEPRDFWGPHHMLHNLKDEDVPGFEIVYMTGDCKIGPKPIWNDSLMMCKWYKIEKANVVAYISTKDRYYKTLPLAIAGIATQTKKPNHFILFDDSDNPLDLRDEGLYGNLFGIFDKVGITWEVVYGEKRGQVLNHQKALFSAKADILWRLDDDDYPEANVLETLLSEMKEGVGGVGCKIWHPNMPLFNLPKYALGKLKYDLYDMVPQWFIPPNDEIMEVEHLNSTFIFRRDVGVRAGGYPMDLSPVGHTEETQFTHNIFRIGYRLIYTPKATIWHCRESNGGIRTYKDKFLWEHDQGKFSEYMKSCGYKPGVDIYVFLDGAIGDHYVFKHVLRDIKLKFRDATIIIGCGVPEVFADEDDPRVHILTLQEIALLHGTRGDIKEYNIYGWCQSNNWKGTLEGAFREMYLNREWGANR